MNLINNSSPTLNVGSNMMASYTRSNRVPLVVYCVLLTLIACPSIAKPPDAPQGFCWVANRAYSDEFDGKKLDKKKWHNEHPHWQGRRPARFDKKSISVKDGMLRIENGALRKPKDGFSLRCGAVVSRGQDAHYGYYECRMKASSISMSTTFWLTNRGTHDQTGWRKQEIDIQEATGAGINHPDRKNFMWSNTHYFYKAGKKDAKIDAFISQNAPLPSPANETFHVYGAWWVDANTIHYYLNDVLVFTLHPSTEYSATPFDQPMYVNLVTETYDWEVPPTEAEVTNPAINTSYYDWVRAYTLTPIQ